MVNSEFTIPFSFFFFKLPLVSYYLVEIPIICYSLKNHILLSKFYMHHNIKQSFKKESTKNIYLFSKLPL